MRALIGAATTAALITAGAGCGAQQGADGPAAAEPAGQEAGPPVTLPVAVGGDLYVGGHHVPGRWYAAGGRGTHWIALREDRTWWWGFDEEPQRIDGQVDQSVVISPSGGYTAHVLTEPDGGWTLVGADTEWAGEGLGGVDLPRGGSSPPPRAVAVTDDGLVVAGGPHFQWLWRPLVDNATVDLAETAPGQVVVGSTDAGLVVNEGRYDRTDGQQGSPYLATIDSDGTLTRLGPLPTHDVLEAGEQWIAYAPPGTLGGETSGIPELQVQRRDGSAAGRLTAPDGWVFLAPGFRWESADQLLAVLASEDGQTERLARCRPDTSTCEVVLPAG
ncbi:hypothetical protein NYO98_04020 [Nocardioides sp. STR2]|uniref:Tachylectin n=1 Tax=Nocardioides pini TaxID=2975053 RepID=A0ABT4C8Z5_9ACTN|nr:hypothetical protein [Nocardioides pini]MCY4725435.1 hypothetical protein [Nocardioides pini]